MVEAPRGEAPRGHPWAGTAGTPIERIERRGTAAGTAIKFIEYVFGQSMRRAERGLLPLSTVTCPDRCKLPVLHSDESLFATLLDAHYPRRDPRPLWARAV